MSERIVVTRSKDQADAFARRLAAVGFTPVVFPVIQLAPLPAPALDEALAQIHRYDWLLLTSGNGVDFFFRRLEALGLDLQLPPVAVTGSATARQLSARGVSPAFVPEEFVGEQLVAGLGELMGRRVLLPRARIGRPEIVTLLAAQGAQVDDIPLYDTVTADPAPEAVAELGRGFDAVTFTSPSSVRNFFKIVTEERPAQLAAPVAACLERAVVACIGPVTAAAVRERGRRVDLVPEAYTIDGLVQSLLTYFRPDFQAWNA